MGGVAPFGYRWSGGRLVVDEAEAPVRRLVYELFLKYRRKKTVAKVLNDLGHRTRSSSKFSDTTVDRLLRDSIAKGVREVDGELISVDRMIPDELWDQVNHLLGGSKQSKRVVHLFAGLVHCRCGGKMVVPSNSPKFVCVDCRLKIPIADLEAVYRSQMRGRPEAEYQEADEHWGNCSSEEKITLIEQMCERIVIGRDAITIRFGFGYSPNPIESATHGQHNGHSNETPKANGPSVDINGNDDDALLSEKETAELLGLSKLTLMRKRKSGEIVYFKLGHRIMYSKKKHVNKYLIESEKGG